MRRISYLMLLCAIGLLSVASTQAADNAAQPGALSGAVTDPSVARIAYLEDKVANLESSVQTGQGSSCDSCCEEACNACCGPRLCGNPGFIGGYDFLWLKPHFSNSVSYSVQDVVGANTTTLYHSYPTDYEFAPRFWIGYQGYNGLGMRLRYTQYDQKLLEGTIDTTADSTATFNGIDATGGETLTFCTGMEMHVLDVEFTKNFDLCCAQITAGAGLRYGKTLFDATGAIIDAVDVTTEALALENTFEGVGPTAFVDFKAPIRASQLSVIGGVRGSVLFGRRYTIEDWTDTVAPVTTTADIWRGNRTTGMIDASLGLQYDRCLTSGVDAFVRLTWEGQLWTDVGSPTDSNSDMAMEGIAIGFGILR